jgi:hypothetical protein
LKNAILSLESNHITLAECFIVLIQIAAKINNMSSETDMICFKNHCIQKINTRWESFDFDPYMLAYILHPDYRGNFKIKNKCINLYLLFTYFNFIYLFKGFGLSNEMWQKIGKYAGSFLPNFNCNNKSGAKSLIANIANFKCQEGIYEVEYNDEYYSPRTWWQFVDNSDNNILQKIALQLFAVVPHSASCERIFSGLGWFYAKRRQNLSVTTVESMSKIRHFYLTHAAYNELQYSGKNYTKEAITNMLKESNLFSNEEEEDDDDDVDDLEVNRIEIPQNEVYVLIMAKDIDLNLFSNNDDTEDLNTNKDDKEKDVESSDNEEDFNMDEIIASTSKF